MNVQQIYEITNTIASEVLGRENVVNEDLTNIVDIGNEIFETSNVDNYVKKLINHIGKVIFVDRPYRGKALSVMMDGWEYGSVVEKIGAELPQASENDSWNLVDGQEYKQDIFYQPKVYAKFFNNKTTFEIPMSFTERQVKESFSNSSQLNAFLSMLYNNVDKALTIRMDELIMRTINNFTASTIFDEYQGGDVTAKSTTKAVNLLKLYNDTQTASKKVTKETATKNADFIRFASYIIGLYVDRLASISTLFNIGEKERFTPKDDLKIIMLSEFATSAKVFLQSDVFHNDLVTLPTAETVPYWQGSGKTFDFADTSKINVKTSDGNVVEVGGILAVMFDRESLGVTNLDRRVTTAYNAKGEFYNNFYKFDAGFFNDYNENFVVFFVA